MEVAFLPHLDSSVCALVRFLESGASSGGRTGLRHGTLVGGRERKRANVQRIEKDSSRGGLRHHSADASYLDCKKNRLHGDYRSQWQRSAEIGDIGKTR